MTRITSATKVETVRELTITEYGDTKVQFTSDGDTVTITLSTTDPCTAQRNKIRTFIEGLGDAIDASDFISRVDVLAELDRLDAESLEKYGSNIGQPRLFTTTIYTIERSIIEVLRELLGGSAISYATREAVNAAINSPTGDRW